MSEIKSETHDATPSWNGFNYQGKVGLYICLKMMMDELQSRDIDDYDFLSFLSTHSIQYEWIEDFSILKDDLYISHHQVKHKADKGFSTHIDALTTILNRNQKVFSSRSLIKYLDTTFLKDMTESQKKEALMELVEQKTQILKKSNILDKDGKLLPDWELIEDIEKEDFFQCIKEFSEFSSNAFDQADIFFHTSEIILEPTKKINEYPFPDHLHDVLLEKDDLKSLESLNIYLGNKCRHKNFQLVANDDQLEGLLKEVITQLLSKIHITTNFSKEDKNIYLTGLLKLLDNHLVKRHQMIRGSSNIGKGFKEERLTIKFCEIFKLLQKSYREQNEEYWELYCRSGFEIAYAEQYQELLDYAVENPSYGLTVTRNLENLENFRLYFLELHYPHNYIGLFKKLIPNCFKEARGDDLSFYQKIVDINSIKQVFLDFIMEISQLNQEDNLSVKSKDLKVYHPSAVSLSHPKSGRQEVLINQFKRAMKELPYKPTYFLSNADYFVTLTKYPTDIDDEYFSLMTITDIEDPNIIDKDLQKENITSFKKLQFRHYETAIRELND